MMDKVKKLARQASMVVAVAAGLVCWPAASSAVVAERHMEVVAVAQISRRADCLARAIYWETRGASVAGMVAVAQVILNRAADPRWPADPCAVVFQKVGRVCQFSWACTSLRDRMPPDEVAWGEARKVAVAALGGLPTMVGGALYFHASYVRPGWRHLRRVAAIDGHIFYEERR